MHCCIEAVEECSFAHPKWPCSTRAVCVSAQPDCSRLLLGRPARLGFDGDATAACSAHETEDQVPTPRRRLAARLAPPKDGGRTSASGTSSFPEQRCHLCDAFTSSSCYLQCLPCSGCAWVRGKQLVSSAAACRCFGLWMQTSNRCQDLDHAPRCDGLAWEVSGPGHFRLLSCS